MNIVRYNTLSVEDLRSITKLLVLLNKDQSFEAKDLCKKLLTTTSNSLLKVKFSDTKYIISFRFLKEIILRLRK